MIDDNDQSDERSTLLITIFSMIFTIFSIISCVMNYLTTLNLFRSFYVVLIQIYVESQQIATMKVNDFNSFGGKIMNSRNNIGVAMMKILQVGETQVDVLSPKQDSRGAFIMFLVQVDKSQYEKVENRLNDGMHDQTMPSMLKKVKNLFTQKFCVGVGLIESNK